jgi:hypothetical protein
MPFDFSLEYNYYIYYNLITKMYTVIHTVPNGEAYNIKFNKGELIIDNNNFNDNFLIELKILFNNKFVDIVDGSVFNQNSNYLSDRNYYLKDLDNSENDISNLESGSMFICQDRILIRNLERCVF